MHKKLLGLLRSLSKAEQEKLSRFVRSPYYNERKELVILLERLYAFAPHFDEKKMDPTDLFYHLFPEGVFDKSVLNKLNSKLFQLTEQFVVVEQLNQQPFDQYQLSLQFYASKRLDRHFEAKFRQAKTAFSKLKKGHPARAQHHLGLQKRLAEWMSTHDTRTGDINLQLYNKALDEFFLLEKLSLLNAMIGRQKIINLNYQKTWINEILAHLSAQDYPDWPTISLLKQVLLLQKEPEQPQHYFQLKRLLQRQAQHFLPATLRGYFTYLENAVKNIFPIAAYFEELFSLYQQQLELGILLHDGKIHHTLFKNIVLSGLELGHFDWVESFIEEQHTKIVPTAFGTDAYYQNLANLYYYQRKYRAAQEMLLQANPTDIYYKLSQKSLLARIYFENKELEVLAGFMNTFTKFIFDQKKKIAANKVASYRLFINSLRQLCHLIEDHPAYIDAFIADQVFSSAAGRAKLEKLKTQIENSPVFYSKKWLLEQIRQLSNY